ncbi:NAD-dependent epimerase/dehydratase family protein [Subsaxibacter sp. CAU 1640]|uniref:NAD-dependent epimerase/dehydratase family protein n=1 Tax=Subsaxibacter sp. CAU 1640 TaxID=2933271 RepID=UPI0020036DCE|nr:NAD-dependent epimerase/dehydratase family protein [Subsaxibacter sp. CAU 1640]MCK7589157.1 NAD-dependent epimerase/dehydratase family protein [Subsaxibacter sp. CAU 1640]
MILVTGGTGLVGSHLLFKLTSNNTSVKAIYRRAHKLESVKKVFAYYTDDVDTLYNRIEWMEADLNDIPALEIAFKNVIHVYHCAAFVSFEPDKYHQLRKINIEGTANIVNLCISNNIEKLCYVSSIAAIGHELDSDTPITEQTAWNPEDDHSVYAITKYGAEMEVWRGTQEGVDAVIVNPGIILGPGFWKDGGSGSLIYRIYKGFPYYTSGSTAYVDVDDVISAMTQFMASDVKNESFIVISENLTFREFQSKVAKALGVKVAQKEAGTFLLQLGWRLDWLNHKILGKRRKLSKQMANTALSKTIYDNSKIKNTLNFKFKPIDSSIENVCAYFIDDHKAS